MTCSQYLHITQCLNSALFFYWLSGGCGLWSIFTHKAVPDALLVASFSCWDGVACGQYLRTIQCFLGSDVN